VTETVPSRSAVDFLVQTLAECRVAGTFINSPAVRTVVENATGRNVYAPEVLTMLHRLIAWFESLRKLTSPADYQPAAAAARSVFEIAVDLTLLALDSQKYSMPQYQAWHESAKLDCADKVSATYPKDLEEDGMSEVLLRRQEIQALRERFWPRTKGKPALHQKRWTGGNLGTDTGVADQLAPQHEYHRFYRGEVVRLNWSVHGSGNWYANVPFQTFPIIMVYAHRFVVRWALVAAEMALRTPFVNGWSADAEQDFAATRKLIKREGIMALLTTPTGQALNPVRP
jgi:hypothetical protein